MARMKFAGVGKKIYLVAAVCFLVALAVDSINHEFFVMRGASRVCAGAGYVMVPAPILGLFTLRKVRRVFKERELVTDGIYSICRHPVYALALVAICGVAMLFRSWVMLAVPLATYVAARILIRGEERLLVERFGQAYLDYRKRVPAFFPTLRCLHIRKGDCHERSR